MELYRKKILLPRCGTAIFMTLYGNLMNYSSVADVALSNYFNFLAMFFGTASL